MSDPWVDLGGGVKGKIKLFQKSMVLLYIKFNGITGAASCNMVANIMPADPPPPNPGGQMVKIQLFQNMVIMHIKLKAITNAEHGSIYFARSHLLPPTLGSKGQI